MLFSLFLVGLLLAAAQGQKARPNFNPVQFVPGNTYRYELSSRLLAGIPELADQYAGLDIKAKLDLSCQTEGLVVMQLDEIQVGRINREVPGDFEEDIDVVHRWNREYQKQLSKPIRFIHESGKVKDFESEASDPNWSVNAKKSILSLFNLNLHPQNVMRQQKGNMIPEALTLDELRYYGVYERSVGGICETTYEISGMPDPEDLNPQHARVLNVTKVRNYDNCLTEPTMHKNNFDQRGCPAQCRKAKSFSAVRGYIPVPDAVNNPYMNGCPCGHEPEASPVDQYHFVRYNISLQAAAPVIEGIWSEGKIIYNHLGSKMMVVTHQNVSLDKILPARARVVQAIQNAVRHETLTFRLPKATQNPAQPRQDLPYLRILSPADPDELSDALPTLTETIADEIASGAISASKDAPEKTLQLIKALAMLDQSALEQMYKQIAQPGHADDASDKEKIQRQIFLDALALSGSNKAAIFITRLIKNNLVSSWEAKQLVEAVPQNLFLADTETIDAFLELCVNPKVVKQRVLFASTCIAFGKLVKEGCVKAHIAPGDLPDDHSIPHDKRHFAAKMIANQADPRKQRQGAYAPVNRILRARRDASQQWEDQFTQDVCEERDVQKYVQTVQQLLHQSSEFHQKVVLINTLARMSVPHAIQALAPWINGDIAAQNCPGYQVEEHEDVHEACNFLRTEAAYAMIKTAKYFPKQVLPVMLPAYRNPNEPYQLRLAAFSAVMMAAPEEQVLTSIASELHRETNNQVRSYVQSAFEAYANATSPCLRKLSQAADAADDLTPEDNFDNAFSKVKLAGFYDEDKDFGIHAKAAWVANNKSYVPRAMYFHARETVGPFKSTFAKLAIHSKGMQRIIERITEPNGLLSNALESHTTKRSRRSTDSAAHALEALKDQLNLKHRTDDNPKMTILTKFFGQSSLYVLDEKYIREMIDQAEESLVEALEKAIQGYSGHFVKIFNPNSYAKLVPSEVGIPVIISQQNPIILSFKIKNAKLDLSSHPKTPIPVGFNLTATIQPQIIHNSITQVKAISQAQKTAHGTQVKKVNSFNLPLEISIGVVRPKNLLTVSVIPEAPKEIALHFTEATTIVRKESVIASPTGEWKEQSNKIQSQKAPWKIEEKVGQELLGIGLHIQTVSEDVNSAIPIWNTKTAEEHGLFAAAVEALSNPSNSNKEVHVTLQPDQETPTYGVDFTLQYKWIADEETGSDKDDSDESSASNESDSDESDESSSSASSESNESDDSKSGSKSSASKSSKSSKSSESESNESRSKSKARARLVLRHKIKNLSASKLKKDSSSESSSSESSESSSSEESKESSNTSESQSSKSSKSSESQESKSSSSSSSSSESSDSASSSSSSSESDESISLEDAVFDYEDVLSLILGKSVEAHDIKKIALKLIAKTKGVWESSYKQDDDDSDSSSSDESSQIEDDIVPKTIAHDVEITVTLRGPRPTYIASNLMFIQTFDERITWIKANGHIKSPVGVYMELPTLFCAESVIAYPPFPNSMYYDKTNMQDLKAKVQAELGWGAQCKSEGGILVTGVMEKTEDQVVVTEHFNVQDGANAHHNRPGYYHQCQVDTSEGKTSSQACIQANEKQGRFNQIILDVQYKHVPKEVQNLTQKLDLALKHWFYSNMDNNDLDVENPDHAIRVIAQFTDRVPSIPMMSVRIEKPKENTEFKYLQVPDELQPAIFLGVKERWNKGVMGVNSYGYCAIMEQNFVKTFDNVTFQMPQKDCQYLVTMDCSPKENFAVFASTHDEEANTKKVKVAIDGKEIRMMPPQQQDLMQIQVDGQTHELGFDTPLSFCGLKDCLRIFLTKSVSKALNPVAIILSNKNQFALEYDGKNVRVWIARNHLRGKTCGLCGDNNDESDLEFRGPAQCVYDEAEDFVNSYTMGGEACEKPERPKGKVWCPRHDRSPAQQEARVNQVVDTINKAIHTASPVARAPFHEPNPAARAAARNCQQLVTRVLRQREMTCFSTKPVMQCAPGCQALDVRELQTQFHCLPNSSPFTNKLVSDAQHKVLRQLANKRVDLVESVHVPAQCN